MKRSWVFPGGPVVKTLPSEAEMQVSSLVRSDPHASQPKPQNIRQRQYCNKFNLKMAHIKKRS